MEEIKIQENTTVKRITVNENAYDKFNIQYKRIQFNGQDYLEAENPTIEDQGEIIVNCLKEVPEISIGYNAITYNEPRIKKAMDNRSLTQILIDFVKRTFGYNNVDKIEVEPEEDTESKSLSMW